MTYRDAATATLRDNGGTFTLDGAQVLHRRGYYVGGIVPTAIVRKHPGDTWALDWLAVQLARFARQHYRKILHIDGYLGTWVNDGNVYIDGTQWVANRNDAINIALVRGELAVWDCEKGGEVTL